MNHFPPHPPQNQFPQHQYPQHQYPQAPRPSRRPNSLVRRLTIGFGVVIGLGLFSALASGGDTGGDVGSDSGYSDAGYSGESGGSSQIYESGSITTTDDGELIYSDNSGNSYSSGG